MPLGLGLGLSKNRQFAIPYGPGMPYATVNDLPDWAADVKLSILDKDTGIVSACCWVFHNEGIDYVNCGRPTGLVNLLLPSSPYKCSALVRRNNNGNSGYIFANASTDSQINLGWMGTGAITARVGVASSFAAPIISQGVFTKIGVVSNGSNYYGFVGEEPTTTIPVGTAVSLADFLLSGGRGDGTSLNPECDMAYMAFYNGAGALVDCYDFTDPTKWNGGSTMVSCAGNTATFTDGAPTGIRKKAAIPRNLLAY